jgi:hypothetical protein
MVRWTAPAAIAAVALAAPAASLGGGYSTVGLDSLPDGTGPGRPWAVELTVLAHGRTPVEGGTPRVVVRRLGGGGAHTFDATSTRRPGVYVARVVFPSPGVWAYAVHDSYVGARHTFAPVRIGKGRPVIRAVRPAGGRPASVAEPNLAAGLGVAGVAGLLAVLLTAVVQRRRGSADADPTSK